MKPAPPDALDEHTTACTPPPAHHHRLASCATHHRWAIADDDDEPRPTQPAAFVLDPSKIVYGNSRSASLAAAYAAEKAAGTLRLTQVGSSSDSTATDKN